jgi:predicted CopG family antitoxin
VYRQLLDMRYGEESVVEAVERLVLSAQPLRNVCE